jgi:hypothetical protein
VRARLASAARDVLSPLTIWFAGVAMAATLRGRIRAAGLEEAGRGVRFALGRPNGASPLKAEAAGDGTIAVDLPRTFPGRRSLGESSLRDRAGIWLRTHATEAAVLAALAALLGVVHAWGLSRYPAFFDDEGTYVSQAYAVNHLGALAPYTYWYDHPPLGWIQLAAWDRVVPTVGADTLAIADARQFILAVFVLSTCLLYLVARRLGVRRSFAALATLLFGLSPLALHYQRMVLLDNIAVGWLLAALVLTLTPRRRLAAYGGAGLCFACATLTKETFVLFLPALLLSVWQHAAGPTRRFALALFSTIFVSTAGFYLLFALLRGELLEGSGHTSLMGGIGFQLGRKGTGSVFDAESGTRDIIEVWLALDPILLLLGIALLPVVLCSRRYRVIGVGLLVPVVMLLRPNGYVPAMYILGIIPFAALTVAAGGELFATSVTRWSDRFARARRGSAVLAVVAVVAVPGALAAPRWVSGDLSQIRTDEASASRQAVEWLSAHASPRSTVLTDDTIWTDLIVRGFSPSRTIWFYKLDLDPVIRVPWREFDYVVRTNILAGNLYWLPRAKQVVDHSTTVAVFTSPSERIEIRRVVKPERLVDGIRAPARETGNA